MRILLALCTAAAVLCGVAQAQELAPMTLEAAVVRAVESNPALRAARIDLDSAEAALRAAGVPAHNPSLSAGAGARLSSAGPSVDAQVGLTVPLDVGGSARRARIRESARRDEARAGLRAAELDVAVAVRVAFAEAIAAEQRLGMADDALGLSRRIEEVARRRHELGEASVLEPNSAALDRAAAEGRLETARGEREQAMQRLRAVLGAPGDEPLALTPDPSPAWPDDLPDDIESLSRHALEARADLAAARDGAQAADANVAATRADGLPPVTVGGGWEREGDEANVVGGSVSVELPVQRGQLPVARAEQTAGRAALHADTLALQVERDVRAALAGWKAAAARHGVSTGEALDLAEENRRLVVRAYEAGEVELSAVLAMQRQVLAARAAAIEAELALQQAGARMEQALGVAVFSATPG